MSLVSVEISTEALSKLSARIRSGLWCRMVSVAGNVEAFNRALGHVFFPGTEEEPPASKEIEGKIVPACCQKARSGAVWWERSQSGSSKPGWVILAAPFEPTSVRNCPFCGDLLRVPLGV